VATDRRVSFPKPQLRELTPVLVTPRAGRASKRPPGEPSERMVNLSPGYRSGRQGGAHADNLITTALRGETGSADLHQLHEATWRMVPVERNS